jgi:hypothetical protein
MAGEIMRQAHLFLKLLVETFPYIGMKADFKGHHAIVLCNDKPDAVDLLIWHLGRSWVVTCTMDEFEMTAADVTTPKTEVELRDLMGKIKQTLDGLAADKLSKIP